MSLLPTRVDALTRVAFRLPLVVSVLHHPLASFYGIVQVAHQDAQGDHFPAPDSADVCLYGARLICRPGVRILTGPVVGEVTANSVVSVHLLFICS